MSTVPTDKKLNVTPGSMPKGEWTVEYTPSSPMRGRRRGERTYAQADVYSGELINGGKRCYPDGREEPLYREVIHMAFNDQDPDRVARAEAICVLIADAGTTYNKTFLLPSELAEQLEEALTHLSQMFEGFDFESGLGKPEAADAENAWNFLLSHTNVRTSPTDPTPPEK
jgi:hypothetical protein